MEIAPAEIGYILLKRGFKDWFLYMFRVCERRKFIIEPIHEDLFNMFQDIYDGKLPRYILNVPPRSAKTTMAKYFVVFALTNNPKSNFIYTSFSQALLSTISSEMAAILENPVYKAMYPNVMSKTESEDVKAIDDFWAEYFVKETGKNEYSARKITTYAGGSIIFNSMGSTLTGFGAGIRNCEGFSGMLIMDDPDKPADVRSEVMRKKTHEYFSQTLLSRLNESNIPVLCIQQRLHLEDMSGFLKEQYSYQSLVKPLLNDQGECQIPSQYTEQRIKELQLDNYAFSAQYQQEPIMLGGGVFKHEWWRYYRDMNDTKYRKIFITADTACKTKEWNDFTAIGVWGLTQQNQLRLLDFVHAKLEIPDLHEVFKQLCDKWKDGINGCRLGSMYIEDKASGTQIIQLLKREGVIVPILSVTPEKDKLTRALDAVPHVVSGKIELPNSDTDPMSREFLKDLDSFSADMSHLHDDSVDCFCYAVDKAFTVRGYF